MFGFDYYQVDDENELREQLRDFYNESTRPKLLEVFTPRLKNDKILLNYFEFIK